MTRAWPGLRRDLLAAGEDLAEVRRGGVRPVAYRMLVAAWWLLVVALAAVAVAGAVFGLVAQWWRGVRLRAGARIAGVNWREQR